MVRGSGKISDDFDAACALHGVKLESADMPWATISLDTREAVDVIAEQFAAHIGEDHRKGA